DANRVLDAVRFDAQENGVATGRYPDGDPVLRRLATPTPGARNASWRQEDIVINEIMYDPISGNSADQYVELYNRSSQSVSLAGWKFKEGIDFTFPDSVVVAAKSYLVVAKGAARLKTHYPQLTSANTFGDYGGKLSNNGDRLVLTEPHLIIGTNNAGAPTTN